MTVLRLALGVVVGLVGCTTTFSSSARQPNPLRDPTETLRVSERIAIVTGQMGLEMPEPPQGARTASPIHQHRYPLINAASFTIVSRDRLRFHVQIDHTWEDWADLHNWDVTLENDRGRVWHPESVEHVRHTLITQMWDREVRTSVCDSHGRSATGDCYNTIGFQEDGWRDRRTFGNLTVYRGKGDFVFYERDIMSPDIRWLKLTVRRSGQVFEFTWRFDDEVATN